LLQYNLIRLVTFGVTGPSVIVTGGAGALVPPLESTATICQVQLLEQAALALSVLQPGCATIAFLLYVMG
jgi:hypothetical protein